MRCFAGRRHRERNLLGRRKQVVNGDCYRGGVFEPEKRGGREFEEEPEDIFLDLHTVGLRQNVGEEPSQRQLAQVGGTKPRQRLRTRVCKRQWSTTQLEHLLDQWDKLRAGHVDTLHEALLPLVTTRLDRRS